MPYLSTYRLTWVSLTLDVGYFLSAVLSAPSQLPALHAPLQPPTLCFAPCRSSHEEIPHIQGKRNPSRTVGTERGHQTAERLKPQSHLITQTTALSNSMKLSHARGATQDGWVMVERADRMWSTGEGNGKPLQYSCLENPINRMNSMFRFR